MDIRFALRMSLFSMRSDLLDSRRSFSLEMQQAREGFSLACDFSEHFNKVELRQISETLSLTGTTPNFHKSGSSCRFCDKLPETGGAVGLRRLYNMASPISLNQTNKT